MNYKQITIAAAFLAITVTGNAQSLQKRAQIMGGGDRDSGKCTIEVVVDGSAEVEVRGESATLRTLAGAPAQWRRFQCNAPMPNNPANFRFSGIDGRGRQSLVRDPRGNGPAVVRIDDPDGGSEGYTFDLEWGGRANYNPGPPPPPVSRGDGRGYGDDRGRGRRFSTEEAVQVCKDAVASQARDRFRGASIVFRRTALDDNPGRNDWVLGMLEARGRNGRAEVYRFSCSVNFDTGVVRSAQIDRERDRGIR